MKKTTTILGVFTMIIFILHAVISFAYFMGLREYSFAYNITGVILAGIMTFHFIFGLIIIIRTSKKTANERFYMKYILEYSLHNMTGIFSFALALVHSLFIELNRYFQTPIFSMCWLITDVLLYTVVFVHLSISIPHMFIGFGLCTNSDTYKKIKKVTYILGVICTVLLIFSHIVFSFR